MGESRCNGVMVEQLLGNGSSSFIVSGAQPTRTNRRDPAANKPPPYLAMSIACDVPPGMPQIWGFLRSTSTGTIDFHVDECGFHSRTTRHYRTANIAHNV